MYTLVACIAADALGCEVLLPPAERTFGDREDSGADLAGAGEVRFTYLADTVPDGGVDLGKDVGLAKDQQVLALDLDLGAAVLAVEDGVALSDVERDPLLAFIVEPAVADGDDLAALRLLLRGIGEDDAAGGRLLLLDGPHDQPIAKGLELQAQ